MRPKHSLSTCCTTFRVLVCVIAVDRQQVAGFHESVLDRRVSLWVMSRLHPLHQKPHLKQTCLTSLQGRLLGSVGVV